MPHRFHGSWKLIRYEAIHEDGSVTLPLGEEPQGLLIYTPQGMMSGQAARRVADETAKGPLDNYIAYFGTFTVDEDAQEVVHRVEGSAYRNWVGTEQRRGFAFSGNRMTLTAAVKKTGALGKLTWERLA
ncbi:MAG: lipocalin-like domain-containing protein [Bryobacterales bacterium]|nr:lipocalin-like domain-containing protein [Bryobacterales bacterium]